MSHEKDFIHTLGHLVFIALYVLLLLLTIFFYNYSALSTLLYLGWTLLLIGIVFLFWSNLLRKSQGGFVDTGLYALVRHPEFLGHILIILALILLTQFWVSLLTGFILVMLLYIAMIEEERRNLEKFGDLYEEYMKNVPRINLLSGIIKSIRKK